MTAVFSAVTCLHFKMIFCRRCVREPNDRRLVSSSPILKPKRGQRTVIEALLLCLTPSGPLVGTLPSAALIGVGEEFMTRVERINDL